MSCIHGKVRNCAGEYFLSHKRIYFQYSCLQKSIYINQPLQITPSLSYLPYLLKNHSLHLHAWPRKNHPMIESHVCMSGIGVLESIPQINGRYLSPYTLEGMLSCLQCMRLREQSAIR